MLKKKIENNSGFTLVELMVSVAIIAIISAMTLVNFRSTNNSAASSMAVQKLASDIRMVQGWALSLKDFNGSSPDGGWGIRFLKGKGSYIIFADIDGSKKYRASEDGTVNNENYKVVKILNDIKVNTLKFNGITDRKYGYIVFIPPEPETEIGGSPNESNDNLQIGSADTIEIELEGDNKVIINKYGMVDVD
ncbi:MAG: prepilin-type N-terminal cleavage/methylation domain-containing protein [Clostridiales bacterium]|nr:prepilin-type N-terminal cleavage/methylation domain-containing protein [Clostridiales bacterium]